MVLHLLSQNLNIRESKSPIPTWPTVTTNTYLQFTVNAFNGREKNTAEWWKIRNTYYLCGKNMTREETVLTYLREHDIPFTNYNHPEGKTIEEARRWWKDDGSVHCKNLFFRNHKGNRHYLVAFDCEQNLAIHDLERRLRQGKLSFASEQRMERWLGLRPGSVSPFGLINDPEHHVHLFLDRNLERFPAYSFHPNDNRATVVVSRSEFLRYLAAVGNTYEFIELY